MSLWYEASVKCLNCGTELDVIIHPDDDFAIVECEWCERKNRVSLKQEIVVRLEEEEPK